MWVLAVWLVVALAVVVVGQTDNGALPKLTQSRQSYDMMSEGFGPGSNGPMLVAVSLEKPAHNDEAVVHGLASTARVITSAAI